MAEINSYEYWLTQLSGRSEATQAVYKIYFRQFCEFMECQPNDLIKKYDESKSRAVDPREQYEIEFQVRQWLNELKKTKSDATIKQAYISVNSFFSLNRRPLLFMSQDKPSAKSNGSRIPEKKEVIGIADTAKSKYRAAVMVLKDSGLRCSDVVQLRWEDKVDMGDGFWHWRLETQKTGQVAMVYVGPEATRLLGQFKNKTGRIFGASRNTFNKKINRLIRMAGIKDLTAHGLRKYYVSSMQAARVPEQNYLTMMGKSASVYSENRRSELFQVYTKAYPKLSIYSPENKTISDLAREVTRLQKENKKLEGQHENLKQKFARLESTYEATAILYKQLDRKELEKMIRGILEEKEVTTP